MGVVVFLDYTCAMPHLCLLAIDDMTMSFEAIKRPLKLLLRVMITRLRRELPMILVASMLRFETTSASHLNAMALNKIAITCLTSSSISLKFVNFVIVISRYVRI